MNFYRPDTGQLSAIARLVRDAEFHKLSGCWTSEWRSREDGSRISSFRPEQEAHAVVLASLRTSDGHLTAPYLAVAAVRSSGVEALSAIVDYGEGAVIAGHGRWGGPPR